MLRELSLGVALLMHCVLTLGALERVKQAEAANPVPLGLVPAEFYLGPSCLDLRGLTRRCEVMWKERSPARPQPSQQSLFAHASPLLTAIEAAFS